MVMTDPIADMLTRIRNASSARHDVVEIPASNVKIELARILKEEGYIRDYKTNESAENPRRSIRVYLKYPSGRERAIAGIKRISKPGLRVYAGRHEVPRVLGGLGVAILSTSRGVMSDRQARKEGVGGEVICYIW
ncbi:MAG TPA: 30S ribosomal protein S8 [Limnochordia bacterium]|nr:30S ribosomal protein S8 [Limnochordia bacterium]